MRMSTRSTGDDLPVRRIDRILAFMSLGLLILAIVCFFAIIIGTATGMEQADFGTGAWPTVSAIVWIAPPVAFALLLTVLIMTFIRRSRANKGR
ncbi:MAG: multidrug transporter ATPase [Microbacterium sp.]|jgi:ABC-type dipeptide/oligopeptide/nickel transport system permease component|nr:multidrug transporter ATPase [Microbacterium sp.]